MTQGRTHVQRLRAAKKVGRETELVAEGRLLVRPGKRVAREKNSNGSSNNLHRIYRKVTYLMLACGGYCYI